MSLFLFDDLPYTAYRIKTYMAVNSNVWSTVAELKIYLGISVTDFDAVLEDLLNEAADLIESQVGRNIVDQGTDITEIQDADFANEGKYFVQLKNYPVNNFTSIAFNNGTSSTPVWSVEDADNYTRDDILGAIYFADNFSPFNYPIIAGRQNVRIIYQAGYVLSGGLMPAGATDLMLALHMLAAKLYNQRRSQGLSAEKVGNTSIVWNDKTEKSLQEILARHTRYF